MSFHSVSDLNNWTFRKEDGVYPSFGHHVGNQARSNDEKEKEDDQTRVFRSMKNKETY
jgi:hypothetical protein